MKSIIEKLITKTIILLCRHEYKKYGEEIFYIKGTGEDEGEYLLFTRNKETAKRMDRF